MKRTFSGFALLEAAMALLILGIIASFTIPLITGVMQYEKDRRTVEHKEQIFRSLAAYVVKEGKLPSPYKNGISDGTGKCRGNQCVGIVPYEVLGIPEKIAKDGYGYWFTYAVNEGATLDRNSDNRSGERISQMLAPLHIILNTAKETLFLVNFNTEKPIHINHNIASSNIPLSISDNYKQNPILILLIHHGPHGSGAFNEDVNGKFPAIDRNEKKNAEDDMNFVTGHDKDFTHQVYYLSKHHFISSYLPHYIHLIGKSSTENSHPLQGGLGNIGTPSGANLPPVQMQKDAQTRRQEDIAFQNRLLEERRRRDNGV